MPLKELLDLFNQDTELSPPAFEEVVSWLPARTSRPKRLLLLADIHANWPALAAVIRHAQGQYDAVWCLGDVVGYGPHPVECVRFLKVASPARWSVGNHDVGIGGTKQQLAEFIYGFGYKPSERALRVWTVHKEKLSAVPDVWRWFQRHIADRKIWSVQRRYGKSRQLFVHSTLNDPVGFALYPNDWGNMLDNLREAERKIGTVNSSMWMIVGHTHMVCLAQIREDTTKPKLLPVSYGEPVKIRKGLYWICPGSVGQPRDGDTRAAYAILDTVKGEIAFHRVTYDKDSVLYEMQKQGYPSDLVRTLDTARIRDTEHFEKAYRRVNDGLIPLL